MSSGSRETRFTRAKSLKYVSRGFKDNTYKAPMPTDTPLTRRTPTKRRRQKAGVFSADFVTESFSDYEDHEALNLGPFDEPASCTISSKKRKIAKSERPQRTCAKVSLKLEETSQESKENPTIDDGSYSGRQPAVKKGKKSVSIFYNHKFGASIPVTQNEKKSSTKAKAPISTEPKQTSMRKKQPKLQEPTVLDSLLPRKTLQLTPQPKISLLTTEEVPGQSPDDEVIAVQDAKQEVKQKSPEQREELGERSADAPHTPDFERDSLTDQSLSPYSCDDVVFTDEQSHQDSVGTNSGDASPKALPTAVTATTSPHEATEGSRAVTPDFEMGSVKSSSSTTSSPISESSASTISSILSPSSTEENETSENSSVSLQTTPRRKISRNPTPNSDSDVTYQNSVSSDEEEIFIIDDDASSPINDGDSSEGYVDVEKISVASNDFARENTPEGQPALALLAPSPPSIANFEEEIAVEQLLDEDHEDHEGAGRVEVGQAYDVVARNVEEALPPSPLEPLSLLVANGTPGHVSRPGFNWNNQPSPLRPFFSQAIASVNLLKNPVYISLQVSQGCRIGPIFYEHRVRALPPYKWLPKPEEITRFIHDLIRCARRPEDVFNSLKVATPGEPSSVIIFYDKVKGKLESKNIPAVRDDINHAMNWIGDLLESLGCCRNLFINEQFICKQCYVWNQERRRAVEAVALNFHLDANTVIQEVEAQELLAKKEEDYVNLHAFFLFLFKIPEERTALRPDIGSPKVSRLIDEAAIAPLVGFSSSSQNVNGKEIWKIVFEAPMDASILKNITTHNCSGIQSDVNLDGTLLELWHSLLLHCPRCLTSSSLTKASQNVLRFIGEERVRVELLLSLGNC